MHPADVRQNKAEQRARQDERAWVDNVCEPNRIYDALAKDAGYDHNYQGPSAPKITYDSLAGKWVEAVTLDQVTQVSNSKLVKVAKRVTNDTRRVMNTHKSGTSW
jgi:hypothetical protein